MDLEASDDGLVLGPILDIEHPQLGPVVLKELTAYQRHIIARLRDSFHDVEVALVELRHVYDQFVCPLVREDLEDVDLETRLWLLVMKHNMNGVCSSLNFFSEPFR